MFNIGRNQEEDPKKALENADNVLNKGLTGALAKGFMGKNFVDKMNNAIDMGQNAIAGVEQGQWAAQNGLDATAEVLSVQDSGQTVNMNPVVVMMLKVTPMAGAEFEITSQSMVSRIAVPRVGDKIKIKYNPANPTQIAVL